MRHRVAGRDSHRSENHGGMRNSEGLALASLHGRVLSVLYTRNPIMTQPFRKLRLAGVALLATLSACDDPSGSRMVSEDDLLFIRQSPSAPALAATEVSFWAVRGENREVRLPYVNGHECLRFKVPNDALLAYPDGRPFRDGDSIRITVRLVTAGTFNFDFQPAGLRFDRDKPAELRVSYSYRDPDTDGDGDVDAQDSLEFDRAAFWRQELNGMPWTRIGTARLNDTQELRADIEGFTKYAMAGG